MKNLLKALCLIALVAGNIFLTSCGKTENATAVAGTDSTCVGKRLPIAYVDTDSLIGMYDYAKELEQKLVDKMENDRANLNARAATLAKRQGDFQRKVQNNAFLSESSMQQQYEALLKDQEVLQADAARIEAENLQAQQQMLQEISDKVKAYIDEYNKTAGYEVILQKVATIYISSAYDITKEVADGLNKKTQAEKESTEVKE